jgi:uncharacterized protein (DUF952 family)
MTSADVERIYRLIESACWKTASETGVVPYAADDRRDGFLHLSTEAQVLETARRHYAGRTDMLALEIDAAFLGELLRFEHVSTRNESFPHFYGDLRIDAVRSARRLVWTNEDVFAFDGAAL